MNHCVHLITSTCVASDYFGQCINFITSIKFFFLYNGEQLKPSAFPCIFFNQTSCAKIFSGCYANFMKI